MLCLVFVTTSMPFNIFAALVDVITVSDSQAATFEGVTYSVKSDVVKVGSNLGSILSQAKTYEQITGSVANTDYTMTDFGDNSTIDGVDPTNAANKVKITTKPNGAATWAGTTIGTPLGFINPIALSPAASQISVRVYSPAAGLPVRLPAG